MDHLHLFILQSLGFGINFYKSLNISSSKSNEGGGEVIARKREGEGRVMDYKMELPFFACLLCQFDANTRISSKFHK